MKVHFINSEDWEIDEAQFNVYIDRLKSHVPAVEGVLNVVFVDDSYIQALNKNYRHKDKPTDVLSFSYLGVSNLDEEMGLIGEVYISVPTAKRQAEEFNWPLSNELSKLFVHGFLHIFGYDHETDEEYAEMNAIENAVLNP